MASQTIGYIPNLITRTLICVDDMERADFSGRMYNPFMPEPRAFAQAKDMITALERFFDEIGYPQAYFENRSFADRAEREEEPPAPVIRYLEDEVFEQESGRIGTFEIVVRYRLSATWQGDFCWKERNHRNSFRSTLELLRMMDGVLGEIIRKQGFFKI